MQSGNFNFIHLPKKEFQCFEKKSNLNYLMKWSLKGNIKVKYYNFNEKFLPCQKQEFVENSLYQTLNRRTIRSIHYIALKMSFFTDRNVCATMETVRSGKWQILRKPAKEVTVQQIPCTVTSMDFFSRITLPESGIVARGFVKMCMEESIDGFFVNDNLRALFLDPGSESYNLYSPSERREFIFLLMMHFCLGGNYCQQEIEIQPYLDITKQTYKELISVQRGAKENEINIRSVVLKVVAYGDDNEVICPIEPGNKQNVIYLIIDDFKRQVAVLTHQNSGNVFL